MAFSVSPSVVVTERDLTTIIPRVATSDAAIAGAFLWGPVLERTFVTNEDDLVNIFGKPTSTVYKDFMCAASFLAYASNLQVVRVIGAGALNATCTASVGGSGQLIKNQDDYDATSFTASPNLFLAKYPGVIGNSVGVAWANTVGFDDVDSNGEPVWAFHDLFTDTPAANEYHIVVYDATGGITGVAGTLLEKFEFVSTQTTAKFYDGTTAYFKDVINRKSNWLFVGKTSLLSGTTNGITLAGGADGSAPVAADRIAGFELFVDPEQTDISLVMQGAGETSVGAYIIQQVAEIRKDCIALVSPQESDVVGLSNKTTIIGNIKSTRTGYGSSSYAVMDSTYKLMYDRYNDVERWVPLNGDIAGLCARTDNEADPWWSPAGLNRGRIKNCARFSFDQSKQTYRDELYKTGVNPCLVFRLDGPVLFGDKTLQSKPSAFDRINVRRLFIVCEKAIATASKYMLFEFNNEQTRARFVNQVEPFLRDIQGREGIQDFRVICDESNNTPQVIDSNEFVGDIYIKPARSINYIRLNFVAVGTGVDFDEIVVTAADSPL